MKPEALLFCILSGAHALPWSTLDTTLGGRLKPATPLALPCFTSYSGKPNAVNETSCTTTRENWKMNDLHVSTAGSYMNLQSEMCLSDPVDQCLIDNTISPAPLPAGNTSCNQGSIPSYYIDVTGAGDVVAAFDFARKHRVRLSIKNSGHDFMMRNTGKGSLSLWTHNLQHIAYHPSFTPKGCNASFGAAMTVAAGVDGNTAHEFADAHNSTIIGPYSPSVTVSAGWLMGGGHGVLAPVYGLGVDRVLEFHIVTPDGIERTVNACQDPDLFFALRGGGGGTFGVVLSATHRVEPRIPIVFADIHLPSNISSETALKWVKMLIDESLDWGSAGWGGHVAGTYVTHFNPLPALTADNGTAARAAFRRLTDFALSLGGTSNVNVYPSWLAIWNKFLLPYDALQAGAAGMASSRLLPADIFATEEGRESIIDYLRAAQDLGFNPVNFYTPVTTPFVYQRGQNTSAGSVDRGTSVTPAWYHSLWHLQTIGSMAWNSSYADRLNYLTHLTNATIQAEALAGPTAGSHFNEANPFASGWQESYWGTENYEKLLQIKKKYDPHRLLKCWKCIGFEEEDISSAQFACQGKLQLDVDRAFS
ncbi:Uu.00g066130.m01.CDS01 [Anthostomella pinea]|uniref:Uu.00g066130.m01.CDS01 n=1 Tax=Anthostomella pinea TaxID=933095 RepID=A0AAI8VTW5_9PEZI|nr:Uu.00g066130.m01.CDS01 [Anthostomella pinea]